MSIREKVEREFRFQLTNDPLAREIAEWRPGDPAIISTPEKEALALKAYVVALHRTLVFLAEELDRLEIGSGEP